MFLGTGSDLATAETASLTACNNDPSRKGENGACFLYAIGSQVVLPDRLTGPPR
jgi:hypothetical protein